MSFKSTLAASAAALALVGGIAAAQETTGAIRGTVTNNSGTPIAGATVVVTDSDTGFRRSVTTGSAGQFNLRGLSVGGNYSVVVTGAGYQGEQVDNLSLSLGETTALTFDLDAASTGDTIVVVAQRQVLADLAIGPNATFGLDTLETAPAINRNLTDVIRIDPRIYIDESRGDINGIQCGGKNSRFNSLTVDGVRMNDNFGLNSNGYPTERIPFSYDAIEQVSVELAPFDVQYGGFSACNINAVTKSGTNEFHGGLFIDYTSDDLRADSLEGDDLSLSEEDETRWGINVGGPIIQDKLFFFAAYEKLDGVNTFDRGPIGSGAVNEVDITQEELDEIARIASDVYGYDVGGIPQSMDNEDEKLLIKLDWNIVDGHRAAFTYTYNDGYNIAQSDGDSSEFEFANHLYERGAELNSYVGSLYSDWTDSFSTEVRLGYSELKNRQLCLGGTEFGEITVETDDVHVYLGCDDSRHANVLSYETFNLALKGYWSFGNHDVTFGYEREALDVFNLFVQHVQTEIDFDRNPGVADPLDMRDPAIVNFELGLADNVNYNNAPSGDPNDAAADWAYAVNTFYFQDEYDFLNGFVVSAGLRYDVYESDDNPPLNPDFLADYGFGNNANLDGVGLFQPRVAFTWDVSSKLDLRGGIGLYSGGNPNVWYSNNYSNNNVVQFGADGGDYGLENGATSLFDIDYGLCEDGVPVGPGYCVPQSMVDAVAAGAGSNFEINYLDPSFDIPSEWKYALGATYFLDAPEGDSFLMKAFGGAYTLTTDVLYTVAQDSAIWVHGDLEQTGTVTGPNGGTYPQYSSVREASFELTNASEEAKSLLVSASISKDYGDFDWSLGYAYSDAEDVNPMTSSVAFSNYTNRAFVDPQEAIASRSDYNITHRFTAIANYEKAFFGDNMTKVSVFGQANSGAPYSIVWDGDTSTGCDIYCFTPYLDGVDHVLWFDGERFQERNEHESGWWSKVDLKVEQEFPGYGDDKASVFMVIDNFTNLLNDEWGVLYDVGFPPNVVYDDPTPTSRVGDASRYEIRFGARYEF